MNYDDFAHFLKAFQALSTIAWGSSVETRRFFSCRCDHIVVFLCCCYAADVAGCCGACWVPTKANQLTVPKGVLHLGGKICKLWLTRPGINFRTDLAESCCGETEPERPLPRLVLCERIEVSSDLATVFCLDNGTTDTTNFQLLEKLLDCW